MITSDRKFGVEIEFSTKNNRLLESISSRINVVADGSLRDAGVLGGEYVSSILQGAKGAEEIRRVCDVLKKYDASGDHPATSVHVHLDGRAKSEMTTSKTRNKEYTGKIIAVSNKLKKIMGDSATAYLVSNGSVSGIGISYAVNQIDNVVYYSCVDISRHPVINYTYYYKNSKDRFKWLQNVFYFYTYYTEVMESIVSPSRRFGNMYCLPLDKSYDLDKIESAKNEEELRAIWYKNNEQRTHYDDSRYHNVNLHCYWYRNGTVEIRSHGGTVDPNKILLWVKLHQKIVDKLESVTISDIKGGEDKFSSFLEFIEEPLLQEYVKRLLGYYSGIKVNK
jgi:hypothetical protein